VALLSWHRVFALYEWDIGSTPSINRMSVLEAPLSLICIGYCRKSSKSSEEAEKRSNCQMWYQYTCEWRVVAGKGRYFMK